MVTVVAQLQVGSGIPDDGDADPHDGESGGGHQIESLRQRGRGSSTKLPWVLAGKSFLLRHEGVGMQWTEPAHDGHGQRHQERRYVLGECVGRGGIGHGRHHQECRYAGELWGHCSTGLFKCMNSTPANGSDKFHSCKLSPNECIFLLSQISVLHRQQSIVSGRDSRSGRLAKLQLVGWAGGHQCNCCSVLVIGFSAFDCQTWSLWWIDSEFLFECAV